MPIECSSDSCNQVTHKVDAESKVNTKEDSTRTQNTRLLRGDNAVVDTDDVEGQKKRETSKVDEPSIEAFIREEVSTCRVYTTSQVN